MQGNLVRRFNSWVDERGYQYDEDFFTYSFIPLATDADSGVSGTLLPGQSSTAVVNIEQDSAFEAVQFTSTASNNASDVSFGERANISVQITDSAAGRNLFNEPVPMGLVSGSGKFGYILPTPRRFMPKGSIIMTFQNYDTAITYKDIQFNMVGRKLYTTGHGVPLARFKSWQDPFTGQVLSEDFFVYHLGFPEVDAQAKVNVQRTLIEADSDFEARTLSACCNVTLSTGQNTDMIGQSALQIKDGGAQRLLSNAPIIAPAYAGNGGVPMILPVPRVFLARTDLIMDLTNASAATNLVRTDAVLAGRKIFEYGRE